MCSKSQKHHPYRLLKQLPIPERLWNSISMAFIEKVPMSDSSDTILVIVDHLTKQSIFILTIDTITSPMLAKLFILHVFSKHGILLHVTSDQGSEFVLAFFCSLGKVLDMKLHFTSSYLRVMERLNALTRLWNSTAESTAITSRTTGLSSLITMPHMLRWA